MTATSKRVIEASKRVTEQLGRQKSAARLQAGRVWTHTVLGTAVCLPLLLIMLWLLCSWWL